MEKSDFLIYEPITNHRWKWDSPPPYSCGGPPKPKPPVLEWKVYPLVDTCEVAIELLVDGRVFRGNRFRMDRPSVDDSARRWRKYEQKLARYKEGILALYHSCVRESGPVGGVK